MKKHVKYVAMLIITSLIICTVSSAGVKVQAKDTLKEMDTLDIIISAYYCAGGINEEKTMDHIVVAEKIVPLYNLMNQIAAYYVYFSDDCYAVVANNRDNPCAIEFGKGKNKKIESLTNLSSDKIIYMSPVEIYSEREIKELPKKINKSIDGLIANYPMLREKNTYLSNTVKTAKEKIQDNKEINVSVKRSGGYGFIPSSSLPMGSYNYNTVTGATQTNWVSTSMFNFMGAYDHCGATTITNLALLFKTRGYSNALRNNNIYATFAAIYDICGEGAQAFIAGDAADYFDEQGYDLDYYDTGSIWDYMDAIDHDDPCGLLLCASFFSDWHWVLGVGYRYYPNTMSCYMRVNTNWGTGIDNYYLPSFDGALWISGTAYRIYS